MDYLRFSKSYLSFSIGFSFKDLKVINKMHFQGRESQIYARTTTSEGYLTMGAEL